ncbi:hypothetical protein Tco_1306920 [Tanacetum coccineum]
MVLVDPEENEYSHAIRLNLFASKDNMDYEALLAGLAAFIRRGMKALHVFVGSKFLVDQVLNYIPSKGFKPKGRSTNRAGDV